MKKVVFRTCSLIVLSVYMILLFPTHLGILVDYFSLRNEKIKLDLEMTAIADNLLSAQDVDIIMKNSNSKISMVTVIENNDPSTLRAYDGASLQSSGSRVLEYIIQGGNDTTYLFGYLSSYQLSYSSISINENKEIVIRIFCS